MAGKKYKVAVDLGGTKVLTALINSDNIIIAKKKMTTTTDGGPRFLMKSIANCITMLLDEAEIPEKDVEGIAIGVPGTVNIETGKVGNAPNLGIKNYSIKTALEKHVNIPVYVENDVNLAALGIRRFEFANKVNNMLVVFVGTGIGAGFILNGQIYRGSTYFAGEIGHIKVDLLNGDTKTFEEVASRTAVVDSLKTEMKSGKSSVLKDIVPLGKKIKSKKIAEAIRLKDDLVIDKMTDACKLIGGVCANIVTLLNLDTIVFGGGVIEANARFMLPKIKEAFSENVLNEPGKKVKLIATKLGDDAPLMGGITLIEERNIN